MAPAIILISLLILPVLYFLLKPPSIPSVPNATPSLPLIGNAISYGIDPIKFLTSQRAQHGDIFLVDLAIIRIVFFLGPEGTNAILKGSEKSGVSFWAALSFLIGGSVTTGLAAEGWVDASHRIMAKSLSEGENLEYWQQLIRPLVRKRFEEWADKGEPVSLFRGLSDLVMTTLVHLLMGSVFAEKHAKELVPVVRAYEYALQKPETKILPRWASKKGRLMDSVEKRMVELVGDEVTRRLEHPEQYKSNMDYMQHVLNAAGDEFQTVYPYHILGLMNGGHTNQTTTFIWSLLHTTRSGILSELRRTKSRDLLDAVFRETGRIYGNLILLRRLTSPQVILGKSLPAGQFIACSPLATARDPAVFPEADKFRPQRWMKSPALDELRLKNMTRSGAFTQFGKGQHACLGEKMGRMMVLDILWETILGNGEHRGFDVELVSGIKEGVGIDNVGVEAAWAEENLGTPFEKGGPVMVRFKRRK